MEGFLGERRPGSSSGSQSPLRASPGIGSELDEFIGGVGVIVICGEVVVAVVPAPGTLGAVCGPVAARVGVDLCVTDVADAVGIAIGLVGVGCRRAVVAGVADPVTVAIGLVVIGRVVSVVFTVVGSVTV